MAATVVIHFSIMIFYLIDTYQSVEAMKSLMWVNMKLAFLSAVLMKIVGFIDTRLSKKLKVSDWADQRLLVLSIIDTALAAMIFSMMMWSIIFYGLAAKM